jgi:hypothetical protein
VTIDIVSRGEVEIPSPAGRAADQRYVAWFHELDAWTEYWDVYHPETQGRFYFGDGQGEPGLLRRFLPREGYPPVFTAWKRLALSSGSAADFTREACASEVAAAVMEVDALVARLFAAHFGDAAQPQVQEDYLEAIFRFAIDALPAASERDARIPDDDPRKPTAGRHTLEGDLMWFAWALQLEAAQAVAGADAGHPRRALLLAGVATGCAADFAWRGHRRTRREYARDDRTARLLRERGRRWASDLEAAAAEVHALYRIREWGQED